MSKLFPHVLPGLLLLAACQGAVDGAPSSPGNGSPGAPSQPPSTGSGGSHGPGSGDPDTRPPSPSPTSPMSPPAVPGPAHDAGSPSSLPVPTPPGPDSDELFDPERVPRFELELTPAAIAELEAASARGDHKLFVRGRFKYGSEVLDDVGVRIKGESSRTNFDRKPPLKIKFDEFVPGRSFRGLKRLTLNNLFEDPSGIAERLSYHLFRVAKLPAPRANSAQLTINGVSYGLYVNVESVDKPFLRRWFSSDAGNLYEEGQQDFLPGRETSFDLETNELANDRSDLRALITALGTASAPTLLQDLSASLDVEHFLRFTAVEGLVNQWDMYGYTRFYPNNFHIYSDPERKLVFLPWGLDMSWKPFHDGAPHLPMLGVARRGNQPRSPITGGLIFQRCLASATCRARYVAVVREQLAVMETANLEAVATAYRAQIKPLQQADRRKFHSDAQCEASFATVLRTIRERPARVRQDLAAN